MNFKVIKKSKNSTSYWQQTKTLDIDKNCTQQET